MSEQVATQEQKEFKISSFNTISKDEVEQRVAKQQESQPPAVAEPTKEAQVEPSAEPKINEKEPAQPKLPETPQFSFHNEESEKFFNYFKDGKEDELRNFLNEKHKLSSLDNEKNEDIIKLNLQYQNKDFKADEINDLFEEKYVRPEKPEEITQGYEESDAAFEERQKRYEKELAKFEKANEKIDKQIARDARLAKDELAQRKGEIVLPNIPKEQPKTNEPTQEELDGMKKFMEAFQKSVNEDIPNFKGFQTEYESEGAKHSVNYDVTPDEIKSIQNRFQSSNLDLEQTVLSRWFDDKGSFSAKKAAEDIYVLENLPKILAKMASEGANSALKNHIKEAKNIDYSGGTASVQQPKSREQAMDEMAKKFFTS